MQMQTARRWGTWGLLLLAAGCGPAGQVLDAALVDAPLPDAAMPDAIADAAVEVLRDVSTADALGPLDGSTDAAQLDAPQPDAAQPDATLPDAPQPDLWSADLLSGCAAHCDCPQGWFCHQGTCLSDPRLAVYCCARAGCPPGRPCFDLAGQQATCAEDATFTCQTACDCGPAHCCTSGRCVKDTADPLYPGGLALPGLSCTGSDATYCCADLSCHEGRAAYEAAGLGAFFGCSTASGQVVGACDAQGCSGTACSCDPGEVCADTASVPPPPPGSTCHLAAGGVCVSHAAAEAVLGWAAADLLPCCQAGCAAGSACDAGWSRLGGRYAYQRVVASCGPCSDGQHHGCGLCGNGVCDEGEFPATCPEDCHCGDGRCAPEEVGVCAADCGTCGNGTCDPGEGPNSWGTCKDDCQSCGDGWCTASEQGLCPQDCLGACRDAPAYSATYRVCGDGRRACGPDLETCARCPVDCAESIEGYHWSRVHGSPPAFSQNLAAVWASGPSDVFAVGSNGTILHYDGASWTAMTSGTTQSLSGVWGSGPSDVFAVGSGGTVLRFDGTKWSPMTSGTTAHLSGVWGSGPSDVFAVGDYGTVLHYDGKKWSPMTSGTTAHLSGVWGSGPSDVFAVGGSGTIVHFDGTSWTAMTSGTTQYLYGVWGSGPSDVFAVGDYGTVLHFDGASWTAMTSGTTRYLYGVWGSGPSDVFAVGSNGTILRFDGTSWASMTSGTIAGLYGVWGSGPSDVFTVGSNGTVLHYDTCWKRAIQTSSMSDVWGSGPSDVFAVGSGGTILRFDGTSWTAMTSGTTAPLYGVWGSGPSDVFAVGDSQYISGTGYVGTILRFDGTKWSPMTSGTTRSLYGVWGSGPSDVFAVGWGGTVLRFDGTKWSPMTSGTTSSLRGVWGSGPSDVFAVGWGGTVLRFDGTKWSPMTSGTTRSLSGVWGSGPTDVFAVGGDYNTGTILRFDGTSWSPMYSTTTRSLSGVWGVGPAEVYAVGEGGTVLRFDGTRWAAARVDFGFDIEPACPVLRGIGGTATGQGFIVGAVGLVLQRCTQGQCPAAPPVPAPACATPPCGNGRCEATESCDGRDSTTACASDCPGKTTGPPKDQYCCVEGTCVGQACPVAGCP